ncbi:MAG: transcriptional regulator, LysR family [Myxococcaceae bacterium]|nr:transcriptional regulator, LysR family [Myxococcaceae bacterium]
MRYPSSAMSTDRLAAMEIFVRVVDGGSFSAAATQLGVGQPAVSKTVAQLEERLGVRLLVRSTRSLSLTDAGRRFYENAKGAIDSVNQAERVARGAGGLSGTLRVSASLCFSRIHLMPRLPEFLAQHRDMDINIIVNDRYVNLADEGVDLALRTGTLTDTSLNVRKIARVPMRVMATNAYWRAHEKPKTPDDLLAHECVILEREGKSMDEWLFRKGALECTMKMRGRLTMTAAEAVREAVLSRVGIVVVSEWLFSPELASGAVESVLDDWVLPMHDLWAVFPSGGLASAKAREFVGFAERCMTAPYAPGLVTGIPR